MEEFLADRFDDKFEKWLDELKSTYPDVKVDLFLYTFMKNAYIAGVLSGLKTYEQIVGR